MLEMVFCVGGEPRQGLTAGALAGALRNGVVEVVEDPDQFLMFAVDGCDLHGQAIVPDNESH